jgi:hypothetical protein
MFVGNAITDGVEPLLRLTLRESLMMAAFFVIWLGLILAWWREILGGALTVGGTIAFYLLDLGFSGTLPRGGIFLLIAAPGMLFLLYGVIAHPRFAGKA